jgi:hypothetical protein
MLPGFTLFLMFDRPIWLAMFLNPFNGFGDITSNLSSSLRTGSDPPWTRSSDG